MPKILWILEENNSISNFLIKRNLLVQYKKVKQNIISWITGT